MIVPDIVKDKWKSQPTTVEILEANLQAEKQKTANLQLMVASLLTRVTKLEEKLR